MDRKDKTILVVGVTGHQGGAAARHLLEDGWRVRGLTRHPDSPTARHLTRTGVEIVWGDLLDPASLDAALEGVYGVFSMTTPFEAGADTEVKEGDNIADAAARAHVEHFVFSSVAGAESGTGPDWVTSKTRIEQHVRETGLPYTIFRPVTFMENFLRQRDEILDGRFTSPAWPESEHYLIAVDDIGRFVALAFREPRRFIGVELDIAGDRLTGAEIAETFSRVLGVPVSFEHSDVPGMTPPRPKMGEMQPGRADVEECRSMIPDLASLSRWIEASGWRTLAAKA